MTTMNPRVDAFLSEAGRWQEEFAELRRIALDWGLTEELKWGKPCYTFGNRNVVIIQGFKEYCALMFFKGALLKDPERILETPGRTQAGRQIRFTSTREIVELEPVVKAYVHEAVEVEKTGLTVDLKKTSEYAVPEEFQNKLDEIPALKTAFNALTPGRQRAYLFYFSQARQSKTRASRVDRCVQRILDGKGLND
jgi:uncharacterized protein YdeI (YjbR/CyaY-like superfamily)